MAMDFKTFDEETSKIKVAYGSAIPYSSSTNLVRGQELKRVHGLYFPNSKELLDIFDVLSKENVKQERLEKNIIRMDSVELLPHYFVANLRELMNAKELGLEHCFNASNAYLQRALYNAPASNRPAGTITSEDLTKAVGMAFEELGRLHSDIRMVALRREPVHMVIQNLTTAKMGYFGEILVNKKSGNDNSSSFFGG